MAIDIAKLETPFPVHIGNDPDNPLLVNDSFDFEFGIAEDEEQDGTLINPADFTANGGWVGSVEVENAPFAVSISTLDATGVYTLSAAENVTTVGDHRYNVIVTNAALSAQRTIQKGTITIKPRFPPAPAP